MDHLEAQEEHARWLKDLEHWREEHQEAIQKFVSRLLPELEIANFEEALDRHEAAILAHQELVDHHEQRLRRLKSGLEDSSDDVDALHQQVHDRHEVSRLQHEGLARSHSAILKALVMVEPEPRR